MNFGISAHSFYEWLLREREQCVLFQCPDWEVVQNLFLKIASFAVCSVTQLCLILCDPMDCSTPGFPVLHYPSGVCSHSSSLNRWWYLTTSYSVISFSFRLQSFPASGSFPMSQFFASGGQSTGVSASVLLMNIQDWFPLGLTGWISLQSKGLSKSLL